MEDLSSFFGDGEETAQPVKVAPQVSVLMVVDLSNILYRTIYSDSSIKRADDISIELLRHVMLNSVLDYLKKVRARFPDRSVVTILAHDHGSWRRKVFEYYKWSRRQPDPKATEEKLAFKKKVLETFDLLAKEAKEHYPFISIKASDCEADDVCAAIASEFGEMTDVVLVSSDKDIKQLALGRVWSLYPTHTMDKKWHQFKNEKEQRDYVLNLVLDGDSGDGIPNVLSDSNTFVEVTKRQRPMTDKRMAELKVVAGDDPLFRGLILSPVGARFAENMELIDLRGSRNLPNGYMERIINEYQDQLSTLDCRKLNFYRYLNQNGLSRHLSNLELFVK